MIDKKPYYVGKKSYKNMSHLKGWKIIDKRKIIDFVDAEKIWHHSYYEVLHVDPLSQPSTVIYSLEETEKDR